MKGAMAVAATLIPAKGNERQGVNAQAEEVG